MDNIKIWNSTKTLFNDYTPLKPAFKVLFKDVWNPHIIYNSTKVTVLKCDTLQAAKILHDQLHDPLILIFADADVPGGCVEAGAGMQEESLFRRSALHKHLVKDMYPIESTSAIYAPFVQMVNEEYGGKYTHFIACPGLKMPKLTSDNNFYPHDADLLRKKITLMFQVAYDNGHTSLVLGALGCGVWGCPPKHVANIFKEVIKEYDGVFSDIIFAVLGANYNLFNVVFDNYNRV